MKRIVLFSEIENNTNSREVLELIFPKNMDRKKMLFMPSGGINSQYQHYYAEWKGFCVQNNAKFELIDNSVQPEDIVKVEAEKEKINNANILVISGGDPFKLLFHLRRTGMDKSIKEFIKKNDYTLAGYSAGAMILTPTIRITTMEVTNKKGKRVPIHDVRGKSIHPGLNNDLTALHIVDFEIVPHYEEKYAEDVAEYRKTSIYEVKTCTDDEYYIIEK